MNKYEMTEMFVRRLMRGTKLSYSVDHVMELTTILEVSLYSDTIEKMLDYLVEHDEAMKGKT